MRGATINNHIRCFRYSVECSGRLKYLAFSFSLLFLALPQCSSSRGLTFRSVSITKTPLARVVDGEAFSSSGTGDRVTGNIALDRFCDGSSCESPGVKGAFRVDLATKSLMLVG